MRRVSRSNRFATSLLVFAFTVMALCPFAVEASVPAAGATELTSADDMSAMQCYVSLCQANQISTVRQDSFQTIQDVLAHSIAVAAIDTAVMPDPQQVRAVFLEDRFHLKSAQNIPLYILHASLIR